MKSLYKFIIDLYANRYLLWQLTRRDFKTRYLGSYLGLLWAFIHPCVMIVLFWFVFEVGLRAESVQSEYPFILWLICGIVPWFFFAESLLSATNSILEHSYLVKKIVFRVSLLPIVKILSALIIHAFFVILVFVVYFAYGNIPRIQILQLFYYLACMLVLLLGVCWITSSLVVFFKDIAQFINVFIQVGFWFTPVLWPISRVPGRWQIIFKLNPIFYITEGYRNAFLNHQWFWQNWQWTLYFWCFTVVVFMIGAVVFRRLRPHFADVI